ncbi:MAG: CopD family protein [Cyclobacteriaceae bacterium]|nr:CopD family protein [Cyclobacteriaceae bacterium HetDA_MAG_MS6]
MDYLSLKALHIIFIVTWFAGLFYIPRLFIYHSEALEKDEPERSILDAQLSKMTRLLWYVITWPSAIITLVFGSWLLVSQPAWLSAPFMHVKLTFVLLLYLYHLSLHRMYSQLQKGIAKYSSIQLRVWNEVATILLIAIVFLVVKKDQISWLWGTIGILATAIVLMFAIKGYKKIREKK